MYTCDLINTITVRLSDYDLFIVDNLAQRKHWSRSCAFRYILEVFDKMDAQQKAP